jgi:NADPH:quinone reductase-like Zn-dependent oxidoreductase
MKAFVLHRYGPPDSLKLADVAKPTAGDDDMVIRIDAASVNPYDWHMIRGEPWILRLQHGLRRPKNRIPGADMAGRIEAIGRNITAFRPGDDVFGLCAGSFAEFIRVPQTAVVHQPSQLTAQLAACLPMAGLTALQALRDHGELEPGELVLVNGAAGGVGTLAVQIAKAMGARVTGVCSTRNVELVRSLGADRVIDYTRDDFTLAGDRYDVIVDNIGNQSVSARRRAMKLEGRCVVVGGSKGGRLFGPVASIGRTTLLGKLGQQRFCTFLAKPNQADLMALGELVESGALRPVIDTTYQLGDVPSAIAHVETEHTRGKVVIAVSDTTR